MRKKKCYDYNRYQQYFILLSLLLLKFTPTEIFRTIMTCSNEYIIMIIIIIIIIYKLQYPYTFILFQYAS